MERKGSWRIEKRGMLICFSVDSEKFDSNYERNKFFRGLYGWKQTIEKGGKRYVYERRGVLDEMPHKKVDQSSFIVPMDDFGRIEDFFREWRRKVMHNTFKVLLEKNIFTELEKMRRVIERDLEEEAGEEMENDTEEESEDEGW